MKKNNRLLPDWKDSGGLQQVSRMMKCVLFFMLTLVCGVQGKVYSQQYTLDLHLKQTSLEEVFNRIEAQTGLKFLYNTLLTDSKGKVDVEARQEDIRKVLDELLNPLGLTYILNSNHIVVKQADAAAPQEKTVIKGKVTDSKGSPLPRRDGTDQRNQYRCRFGQRRPLRINFTCRNRSDTDIFFRRYAFAGSKIYRPT